MPVDQTAQTNTLSSFFIFKKKLIILLRSSKLSLLGKKYEKVSIYTSGHFFGKRVLLLGFEVKS